MRRILWLSLVAVGVLAVQALAEDAPPNAEEARRARCSRRSVAKPSPSASSRTSINARSPYARRRFAEPEVLKSFADDQVKTSCSTRVPRSSATPRIPDVEQFVDQTSVQLFVRKEFEGGRDAATTCP